MDKNILRDLDGECGGCCNTGFTKQGNDTCQTSPVDNLLSRIPAFNLPTWAEIEKLVKKVNAIYPEEEEVLLVAIHMDDLDDGKIHYSPVWKSFYGTFYNQITSFDFGGDMDYAQIQYNKLCKWFERVRLEHIVHTAFPYIKIKKVD